MCYQIDQFRYIKTEPKRIDLSTKLWEIEVDGKQNSVFPEGPVSKCFVVPPSSKLYKKRNEKIVCFNLRRLAHKFAAVSRSATLSRVSRKFKSFFFSYVVSEF